MDPDPRRWRFGLVGAGRLGGALSRALQARGFECEVTADRDVGVLSALVRRSTCVVLAVPDRVVPEVVASLDWSACDAVVHVSGALGLDVLAPVEEAGTAIGCLHPLQSFAPGDGIEKFHSIVCGVEGAAPLGTALEALCTALGASSVRLEGVDRARYHAAAVFASNYIVALSAVAADVWTSSGLPRERARTALAPLMLGAARNLSDRELARALTGPVARGDAATVIRHLGALDNPTQRTLYRSLGAVLLDLPLGLGEAQRSALRALLSGPDSS